MNMRRRILVAEAIGLALIGVAVGCAFPGNLALLSTIAAFSIFAISYDLILGVSGILSFGHAVFFGVGAYAAAYIAIGGWPEPITGAIGAAVVAAALAYAMSFFVLRLSGLSLIMVTLAINGLFFELATRLTWLTNGDDGLGGFDPWPLFGRWVWDLSGWTAWMYSLSWLVIVFFCARWLVKSPFGLALTATRENPLRMQFVGASPHGHLRRVYVVGGGIAGLAGAIFAQVNVFVATNVLSLDTTFDGLVPIVLGGLGSIYGAVIGTPFYFSLRYVAQQWNPSLWMFIIGLLMIAVMRFTHGGLVGMATYLRQKYSRTP